MNKLLNVQSRVFATTFLFGTIITLGAGIIYTLNNIDNATSALNTSTSEPILEYTPIFTSNTTSLPPITPNLITPSPLLTPSVSPCSQQYPSIPLGWQSEYTANQFITLEELYKEKYGKIKNYFDIYAIAYFNNRKAFENGIYNPIDPIKLSVEKGWTIFLPPSNWIDKYRAFPIPILETDHKFNAAMAIKISGSSTLFPLSSQISKCFKEATQIKQIQVKANNTTLGLQDFCQGDADIFSASKEITPRMISDNGCPNVNFLKFEIAKYAAVVFISENNPYANELREKPLNDNELERLLFSAKLWKDVRSNWGNQPITRYYPPIEGGVFEIVKNSILPDLGNNPVITNLYSILDDDLISQEVANDLYSIGFSSFASYQNQRDNLIAIPINNVLPNLDTITGDNPSYPLTRSLYLYTGKATYDENSLLRSFINFYLVYEFDIIDKLGYFNPSKDRFLNNPDTIP